MLKFDLNNKRDRLLMLLCNKNITNIKELLFVYLNENPEATSY